MTVAVCGEALVDLVPVDGLLSPRLGGGPFNVAVALGRLGSDVEFVSRISTDAFGRDLVDRLHGSNVQTSHLQRGDELTTLALTSLNSTGAAEYSFYAEGTADRLVADPGDLPAEIEAVSFGTLSLLYEPGASVYAQLLHRLHGQGVLTMLDPNIRPAAITDGDAYRDKFRSWLPSVDILKVSVEDAAWLGEGSAGSTPQQWLDAGVTAVVTTRGGDGLSVLTAAGEVSVAGEPVVVADTIGAGDTVHGALLHHLDAVGSLSRAAVAGFDSDSWREALTFAGKAAAITVSRLGADPPWARELPGD